MDAGNPRASTISIATVTAMCQIVHIVTLYVNRYSVT